MIVYVEEVFLQGFCLCFFATFLTAKALAKPAKLFSLILLSCIYAAGDVFLAGVELAFLGEAVFRVLVLWLICILSSRGAKDCFVRVFTTAIFMMTFVGLKEVVLKLVGSYEWLSLVLSLGIVSAVVCLFRYFYIQKKHKKFEYSISFLYGENRYKGLAYLDSGNFLQDNLTSLPIVIIDYHIFLHLTGISIDKLLDTKYKLKSSHFVEFDTIAGGHKMLVFEADKVEIDGTKVNCMLGLNLKGFEKGYNAILGPLLV